MSDHNEETRVEPGTVSAQGAPLPADVPADRVMSKWECCRWYSTVRDGWPRGSEAGGYSWFLLATHDGVVSGRIGWALRVDISRRLDRMDRDYNRDRDAADYSWYPADQRSADIAAMRDVAMYTRVYVDRDGYEDLTDFGFRTSRMFLADVVAWMDPGEPPAEWYELPKDGEEVGE